MRWLMQNIVTSILFFNVVCHPAAHEPEKRLKRVDPEKTADVARVASELLDMHQRIFSGSCEQMGRDYKVYFSHKEGMRYSHTMRVSIEKILDDANGNRLLLFKRLPHWPLKAESYAHRYIYSHIEKSLVDNQLKLIRPTLNASTDLMMLITLLFNNQVPGYSDLTPISPPKVQRDPCAIM